LSIDEWVEFAVRPMTALLGWDGAGVYWVKGGKLDDRAALEGGFVGAEADAGPVGGLPGVREGIAVLDQGREEFVGQMGMAAAMAGSLGEAQVGLLAEVIHALGGERADALGQALGVVGALTGLGILGSGFLAVCRMRGSCSTSGHSTDALEP
jgi:hypothetical protein